MGDVAEILGLQGKQAQSNGEVAAKILSEKPKAAGPKGVKKPKGMSREVFDLMGPGQDSLLPSMQTNATMTSAAFKSRRTTAAKGRWVWATFTNSARANDENSKIFYHWVKSDVQSSDYPYAKFNIKLDPVMYSEDEYEHLLKAEQWSRAETDHLMYICYKYDLRWPVIADRYALIPAKRTEEMQARYYSIVAKVRAHRSGTGESSLKNEPYTSFDYDAERTRREQQEILFRKTREDEAEEMRLREELKFLDAQLKAKKAVKNTESRAAQKAAQENKLAHAQAQAHALNAVAVLTVQSDHMAAPGRPALQSTRLQNTEQSTTLSRTLLKKMTALLKELGVPEAPLPTRAVCDYYDNVRRDCITLLSLHSAIQKKERDILAMKAQYNDWQMGSKEIILAHSSTLLSKMPPESRAPFPMPSPTQTQQQQQQLSGNTGGSSTSASTSTSGTTSQGKSQSGSEKSAGNGGGGSQRNPSASYYGSGNMPGGAGAPGFSAAQGGGGGGGGASASQGKGGSNYPAGAGGPGYPGGAGPTFNGLPTAPSLSSSSSSSAASAISTAKAGGGGPSSAYPVGGQQQGYAGGAPVPSSVGGGGGGGGSNSGAYMGGGPHFTGINANAQAYNQQQLLQQQQQQLGVKNGPTFSGVANYTGAVAGAGTGGMQSNYAGGGGPAFNEMLAQYPGAGAVGASAVGVGGYRGGGLVPMHPGAGAGAIGGVPTAAPAKKAPAKRKAAAAAMSTSIDGAASPSDGKPPPAKMSKSERAEEAVASATVTVKAEKAPRAKKTPSKSTAAAAAAANAAALVAAGRPPVNMPGNAALGMGMPMGMMMGGGVPTNIAGMGVGGVGGVGVGMAQKFSGVVPPGALAMRGPGSMSMMGNQPGPGPMGVSAAHTSGLAPTGTMMGAIGLQQGAQQQMAQAGMHFLPTAAAAAAGTVPAPATQKKPRKSAAAAASMTAGMGGGISANVPGSYPMGAAVPGMGTAVTGMGTVVPGLGPVQTHGRTPGPTFSASMPPNNNNNALPGQNAAPRALGLTQSSSSSNNNSHVYPGGGVGGLPPGNQ